MHYTSLKQCILSQPTRWYLAFTVDDNRVLPGASRHEPDCPLQRVDHQFGVAVALHFSVERRPEVHHRSTSPRFQFTAWSATVVGALYEDYCEQMQGTTVILTAPKIETPFELPKVDSTSVERDSSTVYDSPNSQPTHKSWRLIQMSCCANFLAAAILFW